MDSNTVEDDSGQKTQDDAQVAEADLQQIQTHTLTLEEALTRYRLPQVSDDDLMKRAAEEAWATGE